MANNSEDEDRKPKDKGKGKQIAPDSGPREDPPSDDGRTDGFWADYADRLENTLDDDDPLEDVVVSSVVQDLLDETRASQLASQSVTDLTLQTARPASLFIDEEVQMELAIRRSLNDPPAGSAQNSSPGQSGVSGNASKINTPEFWEVMGYDFRRSKYPTLASVFDARVSVEDVNKSSFDTELEDLQDYSAQWLLGQYQYSNRG